jgi:hypothetical protein
MRTGRQGGIVLDVDAKRTRLTVELDCDSEPIAGRIEETGGTEHEFAGYMSLIETLERLRPSAARTPAPPKEGLPHAQ